MPPEDKDPVLPDAPTRESVPCFGTVGLRYHHAKKPGPSLEERPTVSNCCSFLRCAMSGAVLPQSERTTHLVAIQTGYI